METRSRRASIVVDLALLRTRSCRTACRSRAGLQVAEHPAPAAARSSVFHPARDQHRQVKPIRQGAEARRARLEKR